MRKIISFFIAVLSLCLLSSCRGAPGLDGRDGVGVINSIQINLPQQAWQYSAINNNNFFFATVDMPEITQAVLDKGLVKMYRVFDTTSGNAAQMEMPYTRLAEEAVGEDEWVFYTETVDYEFSKGQIIIMYTVSDFNYELDEGFIPETMKFRCVVMY